jgi:hypothetical protein
MALWGSKRCTTVAYTITNIFLSKYFERTILDKCLLHLISVCLPSSHPHLFPLRLTLSLAPCRGRQRKLSFVSVPAFPSQISQSFFPSNLAFFDHVSERDAARIYFFITETLTLPLSYHTQHNFGILRESAELASTRFYEVTESCR